MAGKELWCAKIHGKSIERKRRRRGIFPAASRGRRSAGRGDRGGGSRRRAALQWRRVKRWGEGVGARESEKRGETEALARFI
jgi:hypothetical protein